MEKDIQGSPRYVLQAYHLAETLKLKLIEPAMDMSAVTRSATKLIYQDGEASFFFLYRFGSLVFFNVEPQRQSEIIAKIKAIIGKPDILVTSDKYSLQVKEDAKNMVQFERVYIDKLTLDRIELMALVMAQSTTLEFFEIKVDRLLAKASEISTALKDRGRLRKGARYINKFMGSCMATKQDLVMSMYLLDKPDETWEDQVLDGLYRDATEMFELKERYKTIDYKLKMIQENLEVIGDLLTSNKAAFLELLIVILIAVEIVLFVYELWLK